MKKKRNIRFYINAQDVKKRNQFAFFLSSIIPLFFLTYLTLSFILPDLKIGSQNMILSTGAITIFLLLILALSGYYMTIKDTEHLISQADNLSKHITKINDFSFRGLINPTHDMKYMLEQMLSVAMTLTNCKTGAILLSEEGSEMLSYAVISGKGISNLEGKLVPSKLGITGFCFNNKKSYYTNDTSKDALFDLRTDRPGELGVEKIMVCPLYKESAVVGVVVLINRDLDEEFTDREMSLVNNLILQSASFLKPTGETIGSKQDSLAEAAGILSTILEANGLGAQHHQRVAKYSDLMSEVLLDNSLEKDDLHLAALLHDIGLIFIEPHLRGNAEIYQRHSSIGADLLKKIPAWRNASIIVQHHHENFNGTGYPEGLSGEDIPMPSRILAVAEYFDYLSNESFKGERLTAEEAKFEVINSSGTYFDPRVVEIFAQIFDYINQPDN